MLQQTQVVTVRNYFTRFLDRFPDVSTLAHSSLDEVLGLWSGLGYYSRARNLHRCAQQIMELHGGVFPGNAMALETLPGIGRSTAAAIASLCFGERVAILDANVKRVLTRVLGFDADLALGTNVRALWSAAYDALPAGTDAQSLMPRYTQGLMDLGATVCLPKKPDCAACPVKLDCVAAAAGHPQKYPVRTRTLKRTSQSIWLLWAQCADGAVWLSRRPAPGVWGGLHCLPVFGSEDALTAQVPAGLRASLQSLPVFMHVLTHKDLHLHSCKLLLPDRSVGWDSGRWIGFDEWPKLGLPAPVRKLLQGAASA